MRSESPVTRRARYHDVRARLDALLETERDWVSAMATVACELHHTFEAFHWTGFYRVTEPEMLRIGPYQGGHGCLEISFDRGVCGTAARRATLIRLDEVETFEGHIACAATTRSEIAVPVLDPQGRVFAVLDVDSDLPAAFNEVDEEELSLLAGLLGSRYGSAAS
jgi:L-methionine (R)-S-oxide reductase